MSFNQVYLKAFFFLVSYVLPGSNVHSVSSSAGLSEPGQEGFGGHITFMVECSTFSHFCIMDISGLLH